MCLYVISYPCFFGQRKEMAAHSSILAWKISWTKELGRLQSMGSQSQIQLNDFTFIFTFMHWRRKWQPTPVFLPGESQGRGSLVGCCLLILFFNFTILYWFCHMSTCIRHRYTHVSHPEPSSLLPPRTIPLGRPSAPAPSIWYGASNLDWQLVSYMILYMFQCHSPKWSHPLPLPQSPKDCSIHQCFFCCLAYRVIVIIFLNSIYMH